MELSLLAEEIIQTMQRQHPERQVTYSMEKDLVIHADARLLRIALENLLSAVV